MSQSICIIFSYFFDLAIMFKEHVYKVKCAENNKEEQLCGGRCTGGGWNNKLLKQLSDYLQLVLTLKMWVKVTK